jgi:two-component SAPR family response regulator
MSLQSIVQKPLSGRRVLVVEDEYFLADDIVQILKEMGARIVGPVGELEEATNLVNGDIAIDAAVVDVNLRTELAFPLARILRARKVPFVFTTGYDCSSIEQEFQDIQLWEKPLDLAAMARDLVDLIGAR